MAFYFKKLKMGCSAKELITARAVELNITVKRNDSFNPYITLLENGVPFDFSDYSVANMEVRSKSDSTIILTLTIANGRITLGGTAGTITFNVAKEDMNLTPGAYDYDLEVINSSGVKETILEGLFMVKDDVTKV